MLSVRLVPSRDVDALVPLLRDAEEGDERIVRAINDSANTAYLAFDDDTPVGAAVMRWAQDESEIIYIATAETLRGKGYGKAMIRWILDEARRRGVAAVCVGTANAGLDNIAFYQKCGFRMDSVRKDYFNYFSSPVYENGIQIRDMLVLRYELSDEGES
ncbi:MAG TPA: GNAT family N-acetyltransferase [Oceanobacillus sp.]|nr:GNAT family N-acetyltransferase [Oceanobacillus sp.]